MIANSREWARQRGLLQKNPVHGKEEWKIPTECTFSFTNDVLQEASARGTMTAEDQLLV